MKKFIFTVIASMVAGALSFTVCKKMIDAPTPDNHTDTLCSCPHSLLQLQLYGSFTKAEAQKIVDDISENMPILADELGLQITILDPKPLPAMAYSKTYGRYRADSLLTYEKRLAQKDCVLMGLLHEDISTTIHGKKDCGIIGYSFCPGRVSVVSTHRIADRENTWKTVVHEYLHTRGVPHCPNDDPACMMYDAKGRSPMYAKKQGLCHDCAAKAHLPIADKSVKYIH